MTASECIMLGPLRDADSERLFAWINDPATVRFNSTYRPVHEPMHGEWFASLANDPSRRVFAIRERSTERLLGTVQFGDIDALHRSAQLAIRLGEPSDRGRGFGTQALRLALDHAFRDMNLNRVWLVVFHDNDKTEKTSHCIRVLRPAV